MGLRPFGKKLDVDPVQVKAQAVDIATDVRDAALSAKDWTAPRVEAFIEWLTPRLEQLYADGIKAAAPQVEKAAGMAAPAVDSAHDKIVDDLLPRLVAAVNAAVDKVQEDPEPQALVEVDDPGRSHTARNVFIAVAVAAGVGAAVAAWSRSRSTVDPWAEPWEPTEQSTGTGGIESAMAEAADAVGEAAGTAVAKSREATRRAGEKLAEAKDELSERLTDAKGSASEKLTEAMDVATERLTDVKETATETTKRVRRRTAAPTPAEPAASPKGDSASKDDPGK
jgi:hypothetical protein